MTFTQLSWHSSAVFSVQAKPASFGRLKNFVRTTTLPLKRSCQIIPLYFCGSLVRVWVFHVTCLWGLTQALWERAWFTSSVQPAASGTDSEIGRNSLGYFPIQPAASGPDSGIGRNLVEASRRVHGRNNQGLTLGFGRNCCENPMGHREQTVLVLGKTHNTL